MHIMQILKNLRRLKNEFQNDPNLKSPAKEESLKLADQFIRSHEILQRLDEYEKGGFNFGYLLIQSQRIERTIKSALINLARYKAKKEISHKLLTEDNLNIPLGLLIKKLGEYIKSDTIFIELDTFKKFRDKIIHKIDTDLSVSLSEIESSVLEKYPFDAVTKIQAQLIKISYVLDPETFGFKAMQDMIKDHSIENTDIEII